MRRGKDITTHRGIWTGLVAGIMLVLLLMAPPCAYANQTGKVVRVGWYESPLSSVDSYGRRTGYVYEYQRKLASYTGWTYEYVEGSWSELFEMLKAGEIDLLSDVSYTEERSRQMLFSSYAMGTEGYYLYIAADETEFVRGDYSFFNGKRVGVDKDSVQADFFREWAAEHGVTADIIETVRPEQESIEMVQRGELDAYVSIDSYGDIDTVVPVAKVGSSDFYFAIRQGRQDLLEELDDALSKMQDENRFYNQTLFEKYLRSTGANTFLDSDELDWLDEHGAIRMGYLDDYLAYCATDKETGELTGALKDYLTYASDCVANAHIDFETHGYPSSAAALEALRNGEVDCVFPLELSEQDAENLGVGLTQPIMNAEVYVVVRAQDKASFSDREQGLAAVPEGNLTYDLVLMEHFPSLTPVYYPTPKECLRAVADGKVDCFLTTSYRYNILNSLFERYHLTSLDTGVNTSYLIAVDGRQKEVYSILSRVANMVPDTSVSAALTRYCAEESKATLLGFVRDNPLIAIAFVAVFAALVMVIITQNRMIRAERKAEERMHQIELLDSQVFVDALTSVRNKGAFVGYVAELNDCLKAGEECAFAVGILDCDNLKLVNDQYGHDRGDEYLITASRFISATFTHSPVFRTGGDEFAVILQNQDYEMRDVITATFDKRQRNANASATQPFDEVHVSMGIAVYDPAVDSCVEDTIRRADTRMYECKRQHKAGNSARDTR